MNPAKCPAWKKEGKPSAADHGTAEDSLLLPWSGRALGLVDLGFVSGPGKPLMISIIGAQNAGKTTLLAAWYLLVGRGITCSDERRFAGSYSFAGWEAVASALRWSPGHQPNFPPHTTSREGRAPGLLHASFANRVGESRGYLFTDAPGEWFQKWAMNREAVDGEGARWVAEHADVFLLIADRQALSGPNMGAARGALQHLARRLAAERSERPIALVWTKADISIAPEMEKAVRGAVFGLMPDAREFSVSVNADGSNADKGRGLLELLEWTLDNRRACLTLPPLKAVSSDPLFMYGVR